MSSFQINIDRYEAIREYVIKHDGCTKTQVIEFMDAKKYSSPMTTHNIIKSMVNDGIIIIEPDKKNRQTHHLHINDNYSKIDTEINKIKEIMDLMEKPIRTYLRTIPSEPEGTLTEKLENTRLPTNNEDFYNHFIYPYEDSISMMIKILITLMNETNLTEKDSRSLLNRLMNLSNRLTTQIFNIDKKKEFLDYCIWELGTFTLPTTKAFAQKNGVNLGIRKNIIKSIRDFEKKFLSAKT